MSRPASIATRLTLLFALVSSVVLLALGGLVVSALERHFRQQDIDLLEGKILLIRALVGQAGSDAALPALAGPLHDAFVGHHDLTVRVARADGHLIFANAPLTVPEAAHQPIEWRSGGHHFRALSTTIASDTPARAPVEVTVAIDINHHTAFIDRFSATLGVFILAAALVSALLGGWAVRRGLAPLRLMKARAAAVTATRLDERLPVDAVPPELAELASELNRMLARLEDAFRRLSDFSSDLAHELRTPISNLITETQVALLHTRDAAAYRDTLASNAEEFERLGRMISDMLFLAKADHGLILPSREAIRLEDEVTDMFDFYDALAEAGHIALHARGGAQLHGDRLMLRRALSNLLSNALRHTPPGGRVDVRIEHAAAGVTLTVSNTGATIDPARLPHLFERFYRADTARSHSEHEGAGLGLAITRAIVAAHQGHIDVESAAGVTRFRLHFPAPAGG
ncbi:MAG: heavy metal sensor histidine kinase [Rhodocyclaceae bacterium]|nr:heavy metal sensor histidine kinase [Rhodocyclaceae bacterium]